MDTLWDLSLQIDIFLDRMLNPESCHRATVLKIPHDSLYARTIIRRESSTVWLWWL